MGQTSHWMVRSRHIRHDRSTCRLRSPVRVRRSPKFSDDISNDSRNTTSPDSFPRRKRDLRREADAAGFDRRSALQRGMSPPSSAHNEPAPLRTRPHLRYAWLTTGEYSSAAPDDRGPTHRPRSLPWRCSEHRAPQCASQSPFGTGLAGENIRLKCAAAAFGTPSANSIGLAAATPSFTICP